MKAELKTDERIFGLDLVRGGGMLIIILYHGLEIFAKTFPGVWRFGFPAQIAIEYFFVMSGALIGNIMLTRIDREENSWVNAGGFILRRWLRIYPNYFIILVLLIIIPSSLPSHSSVPLWKYFFFLQDMFSYSRFYPESWSLCVEEWFYLLALLCFLNIPVKNVKGDRATKRMLVNSILVIFAVNVWRIIRAVTFFHSYADQVASVTFMRLDAPFYGVLFICLWKLYRNKFTKYRKAAAFIGIAVLSVAVLFVLGKFGEVWRGIFQLPVTSFGILFTMPLLYTLKPGGEIIRRIVRFLADISYSLYVVHLSFVMLLLLNKWSVLAAEHFHPFVLFLLYLSVTFVSAILLHYVIEKPVLKLRNRISR